MSRKQTVGVVVLAVVVIVALWFGTTLWQRWTADWRGETAQIERTRADENFRIQAYDTFFDRCASVQTSEARIEALEEELETASDVRADEIRATLTAVRAQRATQINQYNADAAKDWTVGQFQANGLPHRLNIDQEKTTCAA